jgi:hypothetical protein
MNMNEFIKKIKEAKPSQKQTGFFGSELRTNQEYTVKTIYERTVCKTCGSKINRGIQVTFDTPVKLSIFQCELLFALYVLNKRPVNYANYHKCIAGKRFIESIREIKTIAEE